MDIQIKKGLLEVCVLALLNKEDSYGYKMIGDLSACVDISESTLYPIPQTAGGVRLSGNLLLRAHGRLRKYYRTPKPEGGASPPLPRNGKRLCGFTDSS